MYNSGSSRRSKKSIINLVPSCGTIPDNVEVPVQIHSSSSRTKEFRKNRSQSRVKGCIYDNYSSSSNKGTLYQHNCEATTYPFLSFCNKSESQNICNDQNSSNFSAQCCSNKIRNSSLAYPQGQPIYFNLQCTLPPGIFLKPYYCGPMPRFDKSNNEVNNLYENENNVANTKGITRSRNYITNFKNNFVQNEFAGMCTCSNSTSPQWTRSKVIKPYNTAPTFGSEQDMEMQPNSLVNTGLDKVNFYKKESKNFKHSESTRITKRKTVTRTRIIKKRSTNPTIEQRQDMEVEANHFESLPDSDNELGGFHEEETETFEPSPSMDLIEKQEGKSNYNQPRQSIYEPEPESEYLPEVENNILGDLQQNLGEEYFQEKGNQSSEEVSEIPNGVPYLYESQTDVNSLTPIELCSRRITDDILSELEADHIQDQHFSQHNQQTLSEMQYFEAMENQAEKEEAINNGYYQGVRRKSLKLDTSTEEVEDIANEEEDEVIPETDYPRDRKKSISINEMQQQNPNNPFLTRRKSILENTNEKYQQAKEIGAEETVEAGSTKREAKIKLTDSFKSIKFSTTKDKFEDPKANQLVQSKSSIPKQQQRSMEETSLYFSSEKQFAKGLDKSDYKFTSDEAIQYAKKNLLRPKGSHVSTKPSKSNSQKQIDSSQTSFTSTSPSKAQAPATSKSYAQSYNPFLNPRF